MTEAESKQNAAETSENVDETAKKTERPPREGSTRLPPFPMVHIVKPKVGKKPKITFDQVPELRKEMRSRLFKIDRKEKFYSDFKRTSQDFWRMELDRLSKISDDNRRHMAAAIKVYLGQTRGSSRAVESLLKHVVEKPNTA